MIKLQNLLKFGTISFSQVDECIVLVFEPDLKIVPKSKSTTVLIKRDHLPDTVYALENYLYNHFNGEIDFPVAFFDPYTKPSDYDN